jgi:hypothetical protein
MLCILVEFLTNIVLWETDFEVEIMPTPDNKNLERRCYVFTNFILL